MFMEIYLYSKLTIYANAWSPLLHVYMTWYIGISRKWLAYLPSWLRMANVGWISSMPSKIFLKMKFIIFQRSRTKRTAFLTGKRTPYNQLLIQPNLNVRTLWIAPYMFNLYNFIFQRSIWKMMSIHILWFDYWTLKEWNTEKVQNHSVSAH